MHGQGAHTVGANLPDMAVRALLSVVIVTLAFGPVALADPTGGASAPEPDPSGGANVPDAKSAGGGATSPKADPPPAAKQGQVSEDPPGATQEEGGTTQGTQQDGTGGDVDVQVPVPEEQQQGTQDSTDEDSGGGLARTGFVVAIVLGLGLLAMSIGMGDP